MRRLVLALVAGPVVALTMAPGVSQAADRATGDWGGVRTQLEEAGITFEADYIAEGFAQDGDDDASYLGNLDVMLTFDTEKLFSWPGGTVFVYGEEKHGSGLSGEGEANLLMQVSSLEAESFTQLAEFWLEQKLGEHVVVRLGKQDGNRDFSSPRFAGNFVNSSFGVLPGSALPSFPAPALGATVLTEWNSWFGVRAAIYEGDPRSEAVFSRVLDDHTGVISFGSINLRHDIAGQEAAEFSLGGWNHSATNREGVFGVYDVLLYLHPDSDDGRSIQAFVRGNWSPEEPDEINSYVGGGLTAHGFLGRQNTIGIGTGHAWTEEFRESFVEVFFKWRPVPWFTVEPDVQVYDTADGHPVFLVLRMKLKL